MGHRKSKVEPHGYTVNYITRLKYKGSFPSEVCIATKGDRRYFAFHATSQLRRIRDIQDSIPHTSPIADIIDDIVLFDEAKGELLWEIEDLPQKSLIESQLHEFALGTKKNGLIHGDLRPWNIFFHADHGVSVIDWGDSEFVDELRIGHGLMAGRLNKHHNGQKIVDVDLIDAERIAQMMRGEIEVEEVWPGTGVTWCPRWCKQRPTSTG